MCGLLLRMDHHNDWDLQAVVRSCSGTGFVVSSSHPDDPPRRSEAPVVKREPREAVTRAPAAKDAASLYDLEYLDLDHKPFLLSTTPSSSQVWAAGDDRRHEVMISFPAAASTSGARPPGRKPGVRSTTARPKRR